MKSFCTSSIIKKQAWKIIWQKDERKIMSLISKEHIQNNKKIQRLSMGK